MPQFCIISSTIENLTGILNIFFQIKNYAFIDIFEERKKYLKFRLTDEDQNILTIRMLHTFWIKAVEVN